jgi:transposase
MRALSAGNHHPATLASYRDVRCTASVATVREALHGTSRPAPVFALRQALERYDSSQEKIAAWDPEIDAT